MVEPSIFFLNEQTHVQGKTSIVKQKQSLKLFPFVFSFSSFFCCSLSDLTTFMGTHYGARPQLGFVLGTLTYGKEGGI